jgi:molybdenum cofactor cytidylyltransferase
MMKSTAIVLASGMSKRMGDQNKLLLPIRNIPMIRRVVDALIQAPITEIILVLGYEQKKIRSILSQQEKLKILANPDFEKGMSTSIKIGVQHLGTDTHGCFICLGDMPYLTSEDYTMIKQYVEDNWQPSLIAVPTFNGQRGHPVFFGTSYLPELANLGDNDIGARILLKKHLQNLQTMAFPNNHVIKDIDTLVDI